MANPSKRKGTSFEYRVVRNAKAKGMEATRQPMSGMLAAFPSDVVVERTLIECKTGYTRETVKDGPVMSVRVEWLDKVRRLAKEKDFERAALVIRPDGSNNAYALMTLEDFLDLLYITKGK